MENGKILHLPILILALVLGGGKGGMGLVLSVGALGS